MCVGKQAGNEPYRLSFNVTLDFSICDHEDDPKCAVSFPERKNKITQAEAWGYVLIFAATTGHGK